MMKSLCLLLLCASLCWGQTQLRVFNLWARGLPQDALGISDGYVRVVFRSELLGQTKVCANDADPWWSEEFTSVNAKPTDALQLEVYDEDLITDELVGTCLTQLQAGTHHEVCALEQGGILFYAYTLS